MSDNKLHVVGLPGRCWSFYLPPAVARPVLMGRHLVQYVQPGPEVGRLLKVAYAYQLSNPAELTPEDLVAYLVEKGELNL